MTGYLAVMTDHQTFQCIVLSSYLLFPISTQMTFLAGSSNSIFTFLLDLFPINEKTTNCEISEIILSYFCILLYLVISFIQFCIYLCTNSKPTSLKYYLRRNKIYSFIQKVNHSISEPTLTFKVNANGQASHNNVA